MIAYLRKSKKICLLLAVLLVVLGLPVIAFAQTVPGFTVTTFATGIPRARDVSTDDAGNVYTMERDQGGVFKISPTGAVSTVANLPPMFSGYVGPHFEPVSGNLFVSRFANFTGTTVLEITPTGVVSEFASGIPDPAGITSDAAGNLYVSSHTTAGQVFKITSSGVVSVFATGLNLPDPLAFNPGGDLFIGNRGTNQIMKVSAGGGTATMFASGFNNPTGLDIDNQGNIYIANTDNGTLSKVTPAGLVNPFGSGFSAPNGLGFDPSGDLFVANFGSGVIHKVVGGSPPIPVDPATRTVENSLIKMRWDQTNAERVTEFIFKPFSTTHNLAGSHEAEFVGNAAAVHPSSNTSFIAGLVTVRNTNSTWQSTVDGDSIQVEISSESDQGYQVTTLYEFDGESQVIGVERTFKFGSQPLPASRLIPYELRAFSRSSFTRYAWEAPDGTVQFINGNCEFGCTPGNWANTWIDLEAPGLNVGLGLVNGPSNPPSSPWLDRDAFSSTAWISTVIPNDGFDQDVTISYQIIPHLGDHAVLESLIEPPPVISPLLMEWIAPSEGELGENYQIQLNVTNLAEISQAVSFSLKAKATFIVGEPCVPIFGCWELNYVRQASLDGGPYVEGSEVLRDIPPASTATYVFTVNEKWAWIEPWNPERFIKVAVSLIPLVGDISSAVDLLLAEFHHVGPISDTYEGVANGQSTLFDVTTVVPSSKHSALLGSFVLSVPAGEATIAGFVVKPLLAVQAGLIGGSEVLYVTAADPQEEFMEVAVPQPIQIPQECAIDDPNAPEVTDTTFELFALLEAQRDSYIRYDAAEDAGALEWMAIHLGLTAKYSSQVELTVLELNSLLEPILVDIDPPTESDIGELTRQVSDSGLPDTEVCILTALGYDPSEISAFRDGFLTFLDNYMHSDVGEMLEFFAEASMTFSSNLPPLPEGVISATIDFDPDTLNAKSKGKWITAYIELPSGYSPEQIDCAAIMLADRVGVDSCDRPTEAIVGDHDEDGISDLTVKFKRDAVLELVEEGLNGLAVTGSLTDGTIFGGADNIKVIRSSD